MSSFICRKEHFIKTRDLTYALIKTNKHFCYWFGSSINEENILDFVNMEISKLISMNYASVNWQYNENDKKDYYLMDIEVDNKYKDITRDLTLEELISLYNAYSCINYQIELDYNKEFYYKIRTLIADNIVCKLSNDYIEYDKINHWEFKDNDTPLF